MKRILTIAASDSGGGAGIQADLKTIALMGSFGMSAITALTAQNTTGVKKIQKIPASFIASQIDKQFRLMLPTDSYLYWGIESVISKSICRR